MASQPPQKTDLELLNSLIDTSLALISQLQNVLSEIQETSQTPAQQPAAEDPASAAAPSSPPPDALSLAGDAASLIKAHATKISLFIINEPFTPSAINKVLKELVAGPIPALVSSVELCDPARYTRLVRRDLIWASSRVLRELKGLLDKVPRNGKVLPPQEKDDVSGAANGQGSIAATGVLWSVCDTVIKSSELGVAGSLVQKVESYRDTLKDVMEELKEWGDEEDEQEDDDGHGFDAGDPDVGGISDSLESSHISTQAMLDDLMNSQPHIPRDDPDRIRERLESCLRKLRLTTLLYQAAAKRRLKCLPSLPPVEASNVPARLDEIVSLLRAIPDRFGDVAAAFYDLDPQAIDRVMDQCFFDTFAASELLMKPWEGQKDEFTDWALKFQVEIKKS